MISSAGGGRPTSARLARRQQHGPSPALAAMVLAAAAAAVAAVAALASLPPSATAPQAKPRPARDAGGEQILSQSHVIEPRWPMSAARSLLLLQQALRVAEATSEAQPFYIRKGANGTLPCLPVSSAADSGAAMNKIEWFKEDKKLIEAEAKHVVVWNTKNTIAYLPETGALLFRGVANEDSGEYHCQLTRAPGGEIEDGVIRIYVQDVPDPPQMPVVTAFTQRSVNISWVPSFDFYHLPILHYVIHVREGVDGQWDAANGIMTPDNRTHYEIIGLKPFTTYSFRVLAVNTIGAGEPSPASHYIITLRQRPDSKLNRISAKNVSSTAIKLEWQAPEQKDIHGEFTGYRIRYVHQLHEHSPPPQIPAHLNHHIAGGGPLMATSRPASSSSSSASSTGAGGGGRLGFGEATFHTVHGADRRPQQVEQPRLDGPLAKEIIINDLAQTSIVVKGLATFTPYKFSVQVSNPAGSGPEAEVLATTDEGVPSQPLELSVLRTLDTSAVLRWLEPRAPNGILHGYQIVLHDIGQNISDTRKITDLQPVMEHTVADLTPYTWYKAHVAAYSARFLGEPSQSVKFRTDVSAPSAPQILNVTCYSLESILIQWQRPDKIYNQIDYYYVLYKLDSAPTAEETSFAARRDKPVNELLLTNLTAGQLYELYVLAGTRSVQNHSHIYKSEPSALHRVVLQPNCESK